MAVEGPGLSIEDLQEALRADAIGHKDKTQDLMMGEDLTHLPTEADRLRGAPPVELDGMPMPEPEPQPVAEEEEVSPEPEVSTDAEIAAETERQILEQQELEKMFVKGKVNGEEREYSLAELLAIKQTQDAASSKLDEYKMLLREAREQAREEYKAVQPAAPAHTEDDEYLTDEQREVRRLKQEFDSLRQHQTQVEMESLAQAEEAHMRSMFEKEGLTEQQAAERISAIVNAYPDTAQFAADLFTANPSSRQDLQKRISTFNTLWQLNKTIEMPEVVRRVASEAETKGRNQAKVDAKRNLTSVSTGAPADTSQPSRAERIKSVVDGGGSDEAWARLMLDSDVFKGV